VPDRFPDTPNLQINQLRHCTENEILGIDADCAKIDHSSSGSESHISGGQTIVLVFNVVFYALQV